MDTKEHESEAGCLALQSARKHVLFGVWLGVVICMTFLLLLRTLAP